MPKEVQDVKEFSKLAPSTKRVTILWRGEFAKVKVRVGATLFTCKMPFEAAEKFLSNYKGEVKEVNKRPKLKEKPKKSRKRKVKQVSEAQEELVSSQEVSK
jgi:hypothetical protein